MLNLGGSCFPFAFAAFRLTHPRHICCSFSPYTFTSQASRLRYLKCAHPHTRRCSAKGWDMQSRWDLRCDVIAERDLMIIHKVPWERERERERCFMYSFAIYSALLCVYVVYKYKHRTSTHRPPKEVVYAWCASTDKRPIHWFNCLNTLFTLDLVAIEAISWSHFNRIGLAFVLPPPIPRFHLPFPSTVLKWYVLSACNQTTARRQHGYAEAASCDGNRLLSFRAIS